MYKTAVKTWINNGEEGGESIANRGNLFQGMNIGRKVSRFFLLLVGSIEIFLSTDSHIKRINMKVKVIRPNPELGVLAHMAGVVKVNPSGTLDELRQDICSALPAHLGSVRFLLLSRKFKIIDPRTESQLVVSGVYKETVYVKVFHGAGEFLIKIYYFLRCVPSLRLFWSLRSGHSKSNS